ncbi:histidinol-phosphate aminotransferase [Flavobacteriaceae bacterium MAR_2010_188]|nr:histidinol-phosphate aminotransferase [Flavobacteriaceae bacterium MAR_2010_188]
MMKTDFNLEDFVRQNVKNLKSYSSARDEFKSNDEDLVFLDANENPFNNGVNRYPDPQQTRLKIKIGKIKNINTENILLGNGSDEVLDLIFRAFCEPKTDNVIILPPTYGMYKVLANVNDIECREVLLSENFQPNVEAILKKQNTSSKLLFICSPNNPTSNLFQVHKIEKLLQEFNGLVVIDEAYLDFTDYKSWSERLDEFPNLIVTQTLSKAHGMAGIRLGICYASNEIIRILNRIKPPYNINELTQQRALQGLNSSDETDKQIKEIKAERKKLVSELREVIFVVKIFHSDANFLLVRVDDADKRYQQFMENGIIVRNRTNEPLCKNCLRFTIGTTLENQKLMIVAKNISQN